MEEEAEPDALAAPLPPDAVHPVVPVPAPHERQAVGARGEPAVEGAHAVLEERALLRRDAGLRVGVLRVRRERRRLEERDALVEHAGVAGGPDVVRDRVRQPERGRPSSGCACPRPLGGCHQCCTSPSRNCRAAARRRCSRTSAGRAMRERHRVLELVAEAEGAAGLVVAGAGPHPAAQVLVEEPAVHEDVEGVVGRPDLHRAERLLPAAPHRLERGVGRRDAAVPARRARGRAPRPAPRRGGTRGAGSRPARGRPRPAAPRRDRAPRRSGRRASRARAPRAARASRSGRGRRCGRRSPSASGSLAWAKATRPANSWFQAFVARTAPVAASCSVTTCRCWPACGGPSDPLGVGEDGEPPRQAALVRERQDARASPGPPRRRRRRARGGCRSPRARSG